MVGCHDNLSIADTEFDFAPYMPDVTKRQPHRAFMLDPYVAMLVRDPPSNAEAEGFSETIKYLHVLVACKVTDEPDALRQLFPVHFVALEIGTSSAPVLRVFGRHGDHQNLGPDASLMDEEKFAERAIEIVRKEFRVDEPAYELHALPRYPAAASSIWQSIKRGLLKGCFAIAGVSPDLLWWILCLADTPTANG